MISDSAAVKTPICNGLMQCGVAHFYQFGPCQSVAVCRLHDAAADRARYYHGLTAVKCVVAVTHGLRRPSTWHKREFCLPPVNIAKPVCTHLSILISPLNTGRSSPSSTYATPHDAVLACINLPGRTWPNPRPKPVPQTCGCHEFTSCRSVSPCHASRQSCIPTSYRLDRVLCLDRGHHFFERGFDAEEATPGTTDHLF